MAVQDYKINYKSDFVLTINGDAGWAVPFCIKFWTGMPSQAYFVGFDGVKYINCRVGDTPTQLLVMFDDHHLPIGKLEMQIAYHTTIDEFPGSVFDEVTNARDVIVTIDGTDYQVMLDFTGEDAPELEFDLPAYANEAERIQNELQRQQNEADRIAAELQREQATAAAVQGAENVNAQLNGTTLTVTNRQGVSTSVNTKGEQGEQGPVGPEGPQGQKGVSVTGLVKTGETDTDTLYNVTFSDGTTQAVAIPKGAKGDTGATGPTGPQGPQGQTGVSITGLVKTGETETDTLYNVTFSNGTTQAVAIPKGEKGDQGPVGPQGPQGPMGDVAVITPEQQAAFTMYSTTGQNTDGPMTQKAVTDNLVAGSISYDNSQSGLAAENVQGALDKIEDNFVFENTILTENASISYGISFISTQVGFEPNERYKIIVSLEAPQSGRISVYLSNIRSASGNAYQRIGAIEAGNSSTELYYVSDSANIYKYIYFYTEARISTTASVQVYELVKHDLDKMSQDIDAIKDIVGTDILLEKNNGLDYTLTNGYINLNGEAVVPSNNDWRKTDDFLPIPENATVFSLENCKGHGSVATIAFYSAQSVDSLVSIVKIPNPSDIIFSYPKSPIPNGALYYRVSFGYNNANLSTQYILFYESSTIKTTVELLDRNIGTSYNGNTLFATHYIRKATSFNFEYLYIEKGGSVSISSEIASSLNIYYCSNSQTWDANDYESIVLHTSTNPYNYTFTKSAGCIRIYNDGTSDINVTIQYKRNANASQQIKINEDIIGRIVEQVGGIQDSFAQSYFFREPVTGSLARVWTSNTLTQASKEKEWLVLYCHGNSDLIENSTIPQTALDYFRANKINVAAIQYQDLNNTGIIGDGFNKYAWGNYTQFAHVIALYNYMQSHYNLHKTVVIAGISMGGLAMGALAYKKTFPIAFCLGVGAVPSLKKMWDNGGEQRKVPIRAAYGMAVDGSDDANVDTFFEGHDWWNMGMLTIGTDKYKIGFPNVYLYYGVDSVFNTDFGGLQTYSELCQSLLNGGVYSKIERVGDGHANPEIWTRSVVEDIWHNELGVPSYTE